MSPKHKRVFSVPFVRYCCVAAAFAALVAEAQHSAWRALYPALIAADLLAAAVFDTRSARVAGGALVVRTLFRRDRLARCQQ